MFEHSLKNAYIGEVIEKSIDLRGKTLAQVQAEGWDITYTTGGYTLDNDGLKTTSTTNNAISLYYKLAEPLTNSNKIRLHMTGYKTRNSISGSYNYMGWLDAGLWRALNTDANMFKGCYCASLLGDETSGRFWDNNGNATRITGLGSNTSGGDVDLTVEIDLSNGGVVETVTSPISWSSTGTLNSTQISSLLSNEYIVFRVINLDSASSNYGLIKTVDFIIS